jgi:hypothetical protein
VAANRRRCHPSVADARAHSASPLPPVDLVVLLLPLEFPSENKKEHGNSVCCFSEYLVNNLMNLLSNLMHSVKFYQRSLSLIITASIRILIRKL